MKKPGILKILLNILLHPLWMMQLWRSAHYVDKLMKILGTGFPSDPDKIMEWMLDDEGHRRKDEALNSLAIQVLIGPATTYIAEEYELTEEKIKEYYSYLEKVGAGQWQRGEYVPAAALTEAPTLSFILKTLQNPPFDSGRTWTYIGARLVEYYKYSQRGPVINRHTGLPA